MFDFIFISGTQENQDRINTPMSQHFPGTQHGHCDPDYHHQGQLAQQPRGGGVRRGEVNAVSGGRHCHTSLILGALSQY